MEKTDGPRRNHRQKVKRRRSSRAAARTYTCDVDPAFCTAHNISEGFYYKLKKQKLNPREMKVGTRTLITFEAAAKWRAEREAASTARPEKARAKREQAA